MRQLVRKTAQQWGMDDPLVLEAIVAAESGFIPDNVGDAGMSFGLLQNHLKGRGAGHPIDKLKDPVYNLGIGQQEIMAAYRQGKQAGLVGPQLAVFVGKVAQRPAAGYEAHYGTKYQELSGGGGTGGPKLIDVNLPAWSQT